MSALYQSLQFDIGTLRRPKPGNCVLMCAERERLVIELASKSSTACKEVH
jgi:hypothetical protein